MATESIAHSAAIDSEPIRARGVIVISNLLVIYANEYVLLSILSYYTRVQSLMAINKIRSL